jgi:hypothetical protein
MSMRHSSTSSLRTRTIAIACSVAAVSFFARDARAGNEAAAEALFVEAKKLVAQGKYAEACPKFAESNRLDRGAGTLIHLGDCYEKNKQTASAWATYKEAASAAQALGRADWEKLAKQRAAALEPKLAKLVTKVPEPTEKMTVVRDGAEVSQASWGVEIPVDAGSHVVEASAPGHKAWKANVTVAKDGDRVEVVVPKLEREASAAAAPIPPPKAPPPPPSHAEAGGGSSQKTIGYVLGAVGVVGVGVGAVTGLMAIGKNNDAKGVCPNDGPCGSREAVDSADSAKSLATVSTIGFVAGGLALAGGAVLILTAPSARGGSERSARPRAPLGDARGGGGESEPPSAASGAVRVRVAPYAGAAGAGAVIGGSF